MMTGSDIARQRLDNQHISRAVCATPGDEVKWLVAVQAQDYPAAKWALGLRLPNAVDADLDRALADGSILRTHVMRPTWHFVAPEDIRWLLELTAPRVNALCAYYFRKFELDAALFKRSNAVLAKALRDGQQLTRDELGHVLQQAGIATDDLVRLAHIIMRAELDGIICSGGRRGKQFTYALLAGRAPQARTLKRDEALAELAGRFFASHGPATVHDLAKWSSLTLADARRGLEAIKHQFQHEEVEGKTYWFKPSVASVKTPSPTAYLLPNYDEYTIGYKDHSAVFDSSNLEKLIFSHTLIIDGRVSGTWKRTLKKKEVIIELNSFVPLTGALKKAVEVAAERYGEFLGVEAVVV